MDIHHQAIYSPKPILLHISQGQLMKLFLKAIQKPQLLMPVFALLALVLSTPSLNNGLQFDDLSHRAILLDLSEPEALTRDGSLFGLYSFVDGNPERTHYLMDKGILPWWTLPELKYTFFRPLTELSIWLDYQLWPDNFVLMHLQNSFWFMFTILACLFYFRQFYLTPEAATEVSKAKLWLILIPSLFYLVSGTHALTVSWIAARNALIAVSFGLLAAGLHIRYYKYQNTKHFVLSIIFLLLSMAAGEIGITTCAFIAAYGIFFSNSSFIKRCLEISPFVIITLAWITLRSALGFGAYGSGYYLDPIHDSELFFLNFINNLNFTSAAFWTGIPVEFFVNPPLGEVNHIFLYVFILNILLLAGFFPFWKNNKHAWFFLFVLILCLVPVSGSKISSRVLGFACIPAFAFMAEVIVTFWMQRSTFFSSGIFHQGWKVTLYFLIGLSLIAHLLLAPVILWQSQTLLVSQFDPLLNIPSKKLELSDNISNKKLVLINPPNVTLMSYLPLIQRIDGKSQTENTWMLSSGYAGVKLSRPDANTLILEPEGGFLSDASEEIFRSPKFAMQKADEIKLSGMKVVILSSNERNLPQKVAFHFEKALEDDRYIFKHWVKIDGMGQFGEFELPAIGESIELPPALPF